LAAIGGEDPGSFVHAAPKACWKQAIRVDRARLRDLPRSQPLRMNKAELVEAVKKKIGGTTSKAAAERSVDAVLAAVKAGLRADKEVQLVGFGTFVVAGRSARRGYNPHTGKPMKIPAMKTIRFRAGEGLRKLA
jgi:DNA-binding protein HU-beta